MTKILFVVLAACLLVGCDYPPKDYLSVGPLKIGGPISVFPTYTTLRVNEKQCYEAEGGEDTIKWDLVQGTGQLTQVDIRRYCYASATPTEFTIGVSDGIHIARTLGVVK